jgi:hypothetical protein
LRLFSAILRSRSSSYSVFPPALAILCCVVAGRSVSTASEVGQRVVNCAVSERGPGRLGFARAGGLISKTVTLCLNELFCLLLRCVLCQWSTEDIRTTGMILRRTQCLCWCALAPPLAGSHSLQAHAQLLPHR